EVPRLELSLAPLDQQDALAGEDEEILLIRLAVIPPARLARLEHGECEADVRKGRVVALEDAGVPAHLVRDPRRLRDAADEPPVGDRRQADVQLFETRLVDHPRLAYSGPPGGCPFRRLPFL